MSARRVMLIVMVPMVALVAVGAILVLFVFEDPAPDRFVVGASLGGESGSAILHVGDCMGGRLQSLVVGVDHDKGFGADDVDTVLWSVVADDTDAAQLTPHGVLDIEVGSVPAGLAETVPFDGPLPAGDTIQVSIDTSRQGYGFFFELGELRIGEIFAGGYGHVGADRFASIAAHLC